MEVVAEQVKKTKHTFSSPERNSRMEDIEKSSCNGEEQNNFSSKKKLNLKVGDMSKMNELKETEISKNSKGSVNDTSEKDESKKESNAPELVAPAKKSYTKQIVIGAVLVVLVGGVIWYLNRK